MSKIPVEMVGISQQFKRMEAPLRERFDAIFEHGRYVFGEEILELEKSLTSFVGEGTDCIAVANGTDALQLSLMALDIGPGDEVITPAFSFFAAAEVIALLGATPVFVDIEPSTFNIDVEKTKEAVTSRTRAIVPVSLFGQCCDLTALQSIAETAGAILIEDAAQSFGATIDSRKSCSFSPLSTTSFFPTKPLGCFGDGGAVFSKDPELTKKIRQLANHGQSSRYVHDSVGLNSRLDTFQAAVLLEKLKIFEEEFILRDSCADTYSQGLSPLDGFVEIPRVKDNLKSAWAQYTIRAQNRDQLQKHLSERSIPSAVHYPATIPAQKAIRDLKQPTKIFPVAEKACEEVLCLPMHSYLSEEQILSVVSAIKEFYS